MLKNIVILLLVMSCNKNMQAQTLLKDSLILVEFYGSMNCEGWITDTNWVRGNIDTWYGVTVSNGRVTRIDLHSNKLEGFIPASFSQLTALTYLDLSSNTISGIVDVKGMSLLAFINITRQPPAKNYQTPTQNGIADPWYVE